MELIDYDICTGGFSNKIDRVVVKVAVNGGLKKKLKNVNKWVTKAERVVDIKRHFSHI